ncbi:MAG: T9SS type A sorting domain-containing protein, partial [Bacteroidales bacterium]|nr:T9SS type A sorting domain-containing protein [Bacteroidales bacterium]
ISFQVPESAYVTLEVYNLVGEKVAVLYEGNVEGMQSQKVKFNGQTLSNGVYFYRLNVNDQTFFNKIVLTK